MATPPTAILTAAMPAQTVAPHTRDGMFLVTVRGERLVGPDGQEVLLRGVNANAFVAYNPSHPEAVPLTASSLREMAALGFDVVRLPLSLSLLEPRPGRIAKAYLDAVASTVAQARSQGLWVLMDLHQDRYNRHLFDGEADGIANWGVWPAGMPTVPTLLGLTNPAVQGAFTSFWLNVRVGRLRLWDIYDRGLQALGRRFRDQPGVLGYDVMNEPNPGFLLGPSFRTRHLLPFYRQAVASLRAVDPVHIVFVEPDLESAALGYVPWPRAALPFPNVVYAPHAYLPVGLVGSAHGLPPAVRGAAVREALDVLYARAYASARASGLPLWIGEFGVPPTPEGDRQIAHQIALQNRYKVGSAFWLWQIRPGAYPWEVVAPDGALAPDANRARLLASPHPTVVAGTTVSTRFRPADAHYELVYRADPGAGETTIAASSLTYPHGLEVQASSPFRLRTLVTPIPGGRLTGWQLVLPPQRGVVRVALEPKAAGGRRAPATGRATSSGRAAPTPECRA